MVAFYIQHKSLFGLLQTSNCFVHVKQHHKQHFILIEGGENIESFSLKLKINKQHTGQ